ncbi:MAG: pitrilysin family protein [Candidatus Omnitrophota bacterium]|jgi:predicted Zn-dependent peptidase
MYQKSVLDNGARIVTHDMKERESLSIGVWVGVGGRYEEDRVKGAAHFLEHLAFKGSAKYSCEEIKGRIEGVGGSLNAFTAEEQTCYYAKIPARYMDSTLDILLDIALEPLLKKKDVERERTVILEEIKMYKDLPQYYVVDLLEGMMWPGHPLGKNLAGTPESVGQMSDKDLKTFHQEYYVPTNLVVAACGKLQHKRFVDVARKKIALFRPGQKLSCLAADNNRRSAAVLSSPRPIEQIHLALGMPGYHDDHPDKYVLNMLHVILGGNMSSRLFNEVREKRGLAYSISTSVKALSDTGMFMVRAGVDNRKLEQAVEVILKELDKIKRRRVSETEFKRAKDYYKGQVLIGLEDTLDHMIWLGESVCTHNRIRTLNEIMSRINKIRIEDVSRVAKDILRASSYNLSLVGPISDEQKGMLTRLIGCPQ